MGGWNAFKVFAAVIFMTAFNAYAQELHEQQLPTNNVSSWFMRMSGAKPAQSYKEWNRSLIAGGDYEWLFLNLGPSVKAELDTPESMLSDSLTPNEKYYRDTSQRLPAGILLETEVQYFPATPTGLLLAANETELKSAKKPAATKSPVEVLPAAVTPSTPPATVAAAAPLSKQRRQRRAKWSAALQTPAHLTVDAEATITLGELLERIRKQHGVPVRVDLAHVLPMTAMTAMTTARKTPKRPPSSAPQAPSALGLLPFGVYQSYSAEPSPPVYYPASPESLKGTSAFPSPLPPATFVPEGAPNLPPPKLPSAPLQAYKPTAVSSEENAGVDAPVSAIKAEVINDLDPGPPPPVEDASGDKSGPNDAANEIQEMLTQMLSAPVNPAIINQPEATVEDVLRQAFDRSFPLQALINASIGEEVPMLASFTKATEWDLLLQDDGILLTTRLNANLHKETRVYSTRELEKTAGLKAEDVARVLTRTVRPWSWKKNFPDTTASAKPTADTKRAAKSGGKISIPKIDLNLLSMFLSAKSPLPQHIRLASDDSTIKIETPSGTSDNVELTEEQLELLGRAWDGLFQGAVSSIQVIYHADPPTGVIEVLPGMLVISQSQGAHREIADLLEQLSQPEN